MKTLKISVVDKIATYQNRCGAIVCGNSDYQIAFTFDSEWDAYEEKTARFIWNGKYTDVEFSGTECPVPIITNATNVEVGVIAGNLNTTTKAEIPCQRSILCGGVNTTHDEEVERYRDETALEADRAEAAADRAAEEATQAATERVTELVGELGVVQEGGTSPTAVISQVASGTLFANALKNTVSGSAVAMNDVSPLPHNVNVGLHSQNMFDISTASVTPSNRFVKSDTGFTYTSDETTGGGMCGMKIPLKKGQTVTFSGVSSNTVRLYIYREKAYGGVVASTIANSLTYTAEEDLPNAFFAVAIASGIVSLEVSEIQVNHGTEIKPYTVYVPSTTEVTLTSCGKNIGSGFVNQTYTVNGTGYNGYLGYCNIIDVPESWRGQTITYSFDGDATLASSFVRPAVWYFASDGTLTALNFTARTQVSAGQKGKAIFTAIIPQEASRIVFGLNTTQTAGYSVTVYDPMVEIGDTATDYEAYKEGETIITTFADGATLNSISPNMSVYTDTARVEIDATYTQDTNAVIKKLVNAIISLGGNV